MFSCISLYDLYKLLPHASYVLTYLKLYVYNSNRNFKKNVVADQFKFKTINNIKQLEDFGVFSTEYNILNVHFKQSNNIDVKIMKKENIVWWKRSFLKQLGGRAFKIIYIYVYYIICGRFL